jgi:lipoyl(octanoyl) transferase
MIIAIRQLGVVDYVTTYEAMRLFTKERTASTPDEIWVLEHPPVFTLGLAGDPANLHAADGTIPLVQVDRGGQITYHGPGQAVIYLLFDLRRQSRKILPREFVSRIEQAVIDTLAAYNLSGERKLGAPGIYIAKGEHQGAKIAALGLKIRGNGCTYHGVSLNVAMDLEPFSWINPCGYPGLQTIDMNTLGVTTSLTEAQQCLTHHLHVQLTQP